MNMIFKKSNYYALISNLSNLHRNRLFFFGLLIKIFLICYLTPNINKDLFLPFIENTINNFSIDPWSSHLINKGEVDSFPYGIIMLLTYLPLSLIGELFDKYLYDLNFFELGFKLTSLVFDYLLLVFLYYLINKKSINLLLVSYWLSPIVIYTNFIHGQLDILPISLLIFSVFLMRIKKFTLSGLVIGLAISSKFSMFIALPFFIIYIYKTRGFQEEIFKFIFFFLIITLSLNLPYLNSEGFSQMVLQTDEVDRLYTLFINYGPEYRLFVIPVVFVFSLYLFWRLNRITQDLFFVSVGIGFLSILIFLPPAPGWTLWVVPFLVYYIITSKKDFFLVSIIYSFVYIFNNILQEAVLDNYFIFFKISALQPSSFNNNIAFTLQQTLSLLLAIKMYIYGLKRNNFYSISGKSILIEIKGTYTEKIKSLTSSLENLIRKKDIYLKSTNAIIDSNLSEKNIHPFNSKNNYTKKDNSSNKSYVYHANYISYNISKIDEELLNNKKTYQFLLNNSNIDLGLLRKKTDLKIQINKVLDNKESKISFEEINKNSLFFDFKLFNKQSDIQNSQYSLITFFPVGFLHNKLFNLFISIASLKVDIELVDKQRIVKMLIEGYPNREDIKQISRGLIPEIEDLSLNENGWEEGYLGIIQIILIANLSTILKNEELLK
tara:strand:- start:2970 stop:4958 length:1989 start_codon:yes stop_codon:yes gene_type:complete